MGIDLFGDDDGPEEDLGPSTFGEELFRDVVQESGESLAEDGSGREIKAPRGRKGVVFLAALTYVAAKKITDITPLAALGANPFFGAKLLARGMFIAFASLLQSSRLPQPFYGILRSFGDLGQGYLDGTIDKARRNVMAQLTRWSALPSPERAMGPSLRIAQGIVEFNKDKIMGKVSGLPGLPASTDGADATSNKNNNNGGSANKMAAALPGMGTAMYIRDYLDELERKAGTDVVALAKINYMRGALAAYQRSSSIDAAYLVDASTRGLISPEDIARALALPDTDYVSSGKKDAAGVELLILARDARLNDIVNIARTRVDEARELTNPKPKKVSDHEGIGPKEIQLGQWGKIKNPTWDEPDGSDVDHVQLLADRTIADWEAQMGPSQAPRPPRTPINWNLRGRLASVWARRTSVGSWFQGKWTWVKTTWVTWRAARNTPPTLPPQPPAGTP